MSTIPTAETTNISLDVLFALAGEPGLKGKKEVEAEVGSRVDLTCSYPCKYYSYQKYWCKWSSTSCTPMLASDQRQPGPGVTCDTDNKTVILSFDSVAKTDQGWYWCGVKRNGLFGETMAVYLQVTGGELQGQGGQGLSCLSGLSIMLPSAEREVLSIATRLQHLKTEVLSSRQPPRLGAKITLILRNLS